MAQHETPLNWIESNDLPWLSPDIIDEIATKLELPHKKWMQDWPVEVSEFINLETTLLYAQQENRKEQLSCLLTIILVKLDDCFSSKHLLCNNLLQQVKEQLLRYPEVMNYWIDDESFSISEWLLTFYPSNFKR